MNPSPADLAQPSIHIRGTGPVGLACALALCRAGWPASQLVLHGKLGPHARVQDDPRVLALNEGSKCWLAGLAAWPAQAATPIREVHVSQAGRLGRTLIRAADMGTEALGWVLSYSSLVNALQQAASAAGIGMPSTSASTDTASLVVHAEGGLIEDANAGDDVHDYASTALLLGLAVPGGHGHRAWERFTREGPLALLPAPPDAPFSHAVVWCAPSDEQQARMQLTDSALASQIEQRLGDRLAGTQLVGSRHQLALGRRRRRQRVVGREVWLGNAAQTLHPVAGQGLNLGLRDAAELIESLGPWLIRPDTDPAERLAAYASRRRLDRELTLGLTHAMALGFRTGWPALEHAAGLSLLALDALAPARRLLAGHLMWGHRT